MEVLVESLGYFIEYGIEYAVTEVEGYIESKIDDLIDFFLNYWKNPVYHPSTSAIIAMSRVYVEKQTFLNVLQLIRSTDLADSARIDTSRMLLRNLALSKPPFNIIKRFPENEEYVHLSSRKLAFHLLNIVEILSYNPSNFEIPEMKSIKNFLESLKSVQDLMNTPDQENGVLEDTTILTRDSFERLSGLSWRTYSYRLAH